MILHIVFHSRHLTCEQRLLYKTNAPKTAPPETPRDPEKPKDGLAKELEKREQKSEAVTIPAERRGQEKVETVVATKEKLAEVQPTPAASPEKLSPDADVQPSVPEKITPESTQSKQASSAESVEKKWYKTSTWSPEERTKAKQIALIGSVAVGGLLLLRWVTKKVKNGAEKVKEKTSSFWSALKFGVLAGALTIGGYLGFKALRTARSNLKMITDARKELETIHKTLKSAADLPREVRRKLEDRVRELENTISTQEIVRNSKETTPDAKTPNAESPKSIDLSQEDEELVKAGMRGSLANAIVHLYDYPHWTIGEESKITQVRDAINSNAKLRMSDVLKCTTVSNDVMTVSPVAPFKIEGNDKPSRTIAAEILITFCADQQRTVLKELTEKKGMSAEAAGKYMQEMLLSEYLEMITSHFNVLPELVKAMAHAKGDPLEAMKNMKQDFLNNNAAMNEAVKEFILGMGLEEEELAKFSTTELLQLIAREVTTGGSIAVRLPSINPNSEKIEEKVLHSILTQISSPEDDTAKFMIPCFQGIFPEKEENISEEQFIKRYLLERMSVAQAVRFYLYKEMLKNGNSSGLIMMQVEVLKLIADSDMSFLNYKKNKAVVRIVESMLAKKAEILAEEWQKMGIAVPPSVIEQAKEGLGLVFKAGASGYLIYKREQWSTIGSIMSEHKVLAGGAVSAYVIPKVTSKVTSLMMQSTIDEALRAVATYRIEGTDVSDLIAPPKLGGKIIRKMPLVGNSIETYQQWQAAKRILQRVKTQPPPIQSPISQLSSSANATTTIDEALATSAESTNTITKNTEAIENFDDIDDILKRSKGIEDLPPGPTRAAVIDELVEQPSLAKAATMHPESSAATLKKAADTARGSKLFATGLITLGTAVDAYLFIDNWKQLQEAEKNGDEAKASILRSRAQTLGWGAAGGIATGGLGLAGSATAGPLGIVLLADSLVAQDLYNYAQELNKDDSAFMKMEPGELLRELRALPAPEIADLFTGLGTEVRKNRASSLYRAYLLKTTGGTVMTTKADIEEAEKRFTESDELAQKNMLKVHGSREGAIANQLKNLRYERATTLMRKEMEFASSRGNAPGWLDLRQAQDLASAYELKRSFVETGMKPEVKFFSVAGKVETLDLSQLPDDLASLRSAEGMLTIRDLLVRYEQYSLAQARALGMGEQKSFETVLAQRMNHVIYLTEGTIEKTFSASDGFDGFRANAVRIELRSKIQNKVKEIAQAAQKPQTSIEDVRMQLITFEQSLAALDPKHIFDGIQMGSGNVLADALKSEVKVRKDSKSGENSVRRGLCRKAEKAIQEKIGASANQALSSLLAA